MLLNYEEDEFSIKAKDMRPTHVSMRRMNESAFHVFEKSTLGGGIKAMVGTGIVSLLETGNHDAGKGKKVPIYQALGKTVWYIIASSTVNKVVRMKVSTLVES